MPCCAARRGEARRGEARRGEARRGEARRGEARRGEARRGERRTLVTRPGSQACQRNPLGSQDPFFPPCTGLHGSIIKRGGYVTNQCVYGTNHLVRLCQVRTAFIELVRPLCRAVDDQKTCKACPRPSAARTRSRPWL